MGSALVPQFFQDLPISRQEGPIAGSLCSPPLTHAGPPEFFLSAGTCIHCLMHHNMLTVNCNMHPLATAQHVHRQLQHAFTAYCTTCIHWLLLHNMHTVNCKMHSLDGKSCFCWTGLLSAAAGSTKAYKKASSQSSPFISRKAIQHLRSWAVTFHHISC